MLQESLKKTKPNVNFDLKFQMNDLWLLYTIQYFQGHTCTNFFSITSVNKTNEYFILPNQNWIRFEIFHPLPPSRSILRTVTPSRLLFLFVFWHFNWSSTLNDRSSTFDVQMLYYYCENLWQGIREWGIALRSLERSRRSSTFFQNYNSRSWYLTDFHLQKSNFYTIFSQLYKKKSEANSPNNSNSLLKNF